MNTAKIVKKFQYAHLELAYAFIGKYFCEGKQTHKDIPSYFIAGDPTHHWVINDEFCISIADMYTALLQDTPKNIFWDWYYSTLDGIQAMTPLYVYLRKKERSTSVSDHRDS